jgi:TonB family protein
VRNDTLGVPFFASIFIHVLVILFGSIIVHNNTQRRRDFLPIDLVDVPRQETPPPAKKVETPPEIKKPPPTPKAVEKPKTPPPVTKAPIVKPEAAAPLPPPTKEEPAKPIETKPITPAKLEPPPSFASGARNEGGGSEAGAGNLFGKGEVGVVPGTGTAGGGGGTAASGLGRGDGAPGLPESILKTNREAKPIQTVRAAYPPMALRAGLESDVALKIEVDPAGNVTKVEITKSGGSGFDEEALKAVQPSRFEPAQRDGHSVPAEFTYVYRFRLRK